MVWYSNSGWNYRKAITINNNSGGSLTGYQIKVTVTFVATMNVDFSDIRFAYDNGTDIPYWLESETNSSTATIWIKLNLPLYGTSPAGDNTIYMYYGKPSATSASNGNDTFDFFDDFEGLSLDGKWTVDANVAAYNVANSKVTITNVTSSWGELKGIHASFPLANNYIVEVKDFSFSDANASAYPITIRGIGLYPASPAGWTSGNTVELNDSWAATFGGYETYINGTNGLVVSGSRTDYYGTAQFKITKDGSDYVRIYIDGVEQIGSMTDPNNTTQIYLLLQAYSGTYHWNGTASYDRVLARKYASPEPTVPTIGSEQTNVTATAMTVTPRESPCRTGICIIDVSVTWTNNGGSTGSFVPSITASSGSVAESYSSENLAAGAYTTHTFTVSGMAVGTCSICPNPN